MQDVQELLRAISKVQKAEETPTQAVKRLARMAAQLTRDNFNFASSFREIIQALGLDMKKDTKLSDVIETITELRSTPQAQAVARATELQYRISSLHKLLQERQQMVARGHQEAIRNEGLPFNGVNIQLLLDEDERIRELISICEGEPIGEATMRIIKETPESLRTDDLHSNWRK